jgi:hypothetical protein
METTPPTDPLHVAFLENLRTDDEVVARLRADLESDPDDLTRRARLLGALTFRSNLASLSSSSEEHTQQLVWWIDHHPEKLWRINGAVRLAADCRAPLYARIRDAWSRQLASRPTDIEVLLAAAHSLSHHEPDRSLAILEQAHESSATDPRPASIIAHIWHRRALDSSPQAQRDASVALAWYERSIEREVDPEQRSATMRWACRAALSALDFSSAKDLAEGLLALASAPIPNRDAGSATLVAHITLGRVALHDNDVDAAKRHLATATQVIGSQIQSLPYHPEMELAEELLRRGEGALVLEFLRKLRQAAHPSDQGWIDVWCLKIENGEQPRLSKYA